MEWHREASLKEAPISCSPPILQELFFLYLFFLYLLLIHFVEGSVDLTWFSGRAATRHPLAAHELNSKDASSFCCCGNTFESSGALGSTESLHATVPAVTKTRSIEGREILKKPEENCRFIREKTNQVLFLWWTELVSNRALNSLQRSDCGTVRRKVGSMRSLQASLCDVFQAEERSVLNLLMVTGPWESCTHAELLKEGISAWNSPGSSASVSVPSCLMWGMQGRVGLQNKFTSPAEHQKTRYLNGSCLFKRYKNLPCFEPSSTI